ncbi:MULTISPECIES: head-tail joining protein [Pacificibacter]|jgi:hypothetical protein|uniref:head-tail joining protein n=1 Tax=Pacificibacter TaxID=1042323 RepID=UPI001C0A1067|nr:MULTISPECIES: hypothetical protein [Pacificibacter]MBU2936985.1 hypothetical protein [Pacificibacter marinus]MDO6617161.1 hypothetical protein [Pacificibacter sp. 1_MG-2023]
MTSVFDGMAGVMNAAFGAPVLYQPVEGEPSTVQASLREGPIEVAGGDGHPILIMNPTLQVPKTVLPNIARGDRVSSVANPSDVYFVINRLPNGSPASDAMIVCELEAFRE